MELIPSSSSLNSPKSVHKFKSSHSLEDGSEFVPPLHSMLDHTNMLIQHLAHSWLYALVTLPFVLFVCLCFKNTSGPSIEPYFFRTLLFYLVLGLTSGIGSSFLAVAWASIFGWKRGASSVGRWMSSMCFMFCAYYAVAAYVEDRFLHRAITKRLGNALTLPVFCAYPFTCYFITKRWEHEMSIPRFPFRVVRAYLIIIGTAGAYFYIVPRLWFREGATEIDHALIRVVMHPLLFETASLAVRVFSRSTDFGPHADPTMIPVLVVPHLILSSLYGRFLIAASNSFVVTMAFSLMVGAIECALRLTSGKRDWLWYRATKGKEYADSMMNDPAKLALRARLVSLDTITEWYSIIMGSIVQYMFQLTSSADSTVTFERMLANIFGQLAIEIVVMAALGFIEEKYAAVPVRKEWRGRGSAPSYFFGFGFSIAIFTIFTVVTLTDPRGDSFLAFRSKKFAS